MLNFAANLTFLFTELPFYERFAAAAASGFKAVEYMFPYDYDVDEIRRRLDANQLEQVLFNLPAGDWAAGERGIACHPGREGEFRAGVATALLLAKKLGVRRLNCLAGLRPAGVDEEDCRAVMLDNLRFAADAAAGEGITLLVEPINSAIDMPGFWLDSTGKAIDLLDELDHPNIYLQYDLYHAAVMGDDLPACLPTLLPRIRHLQLADHPGRHQPGTGKTPFAAIFSRLTELAYDGWIGCEYRPTGRAADSFGWRAAIVP